MVEIYSVLRIEPSQCQVRTAREIEKKLCSARYNLESELRSILKDITDVHSSARQEGQK